MSNQQIIYELDTIVLMANQIIEKSLQVKKKLESSNAPVSPKGKPTVISESVTKRMFKRQGAIKEVHA